MNEISDRTVAVSSSMESNNYSLVPLAALPRIKLVNCANAVLASIVSGSIEFTGSSAEQAAVRKTSVGLAVKGIQRPEIPFSNRCGCEFENESASMSATRSHSPIELPMHQKHSSIR